MAKKPRRVDSKWYVYRGYDLLLEGKRWVVRHEKTGQVLSGGHRDMRDAAARVDQFYEFGE